MTSLHHDDEMRTTGVGRCLRPVLPAYGLNRLRRFRGVASLSRVNARIEQVADAINATAAHIADRINQSLGRLADKLTPKGE